MATELTICHLGRVSRVTCSGTEAQFQQFRDALLLRGFYLAHEQENAWEFRRRAYLLQDDWPIRVAVSRSAQQFEIAYYLSIPWSWIATLGFLAIMVWPFAGFPNAEMGFVLAVLLVAIAGYKQKFDLRPNAKFWQQVPRQRWGAILEHLISESFS